MTTDEVIDIIRRYAGERYPRTPAVRLRIDLAGGETICLPIPDAPAPAAAPARPAGVTQADLTILQAVAELGEEPTGPEIAKAAGYPYQPHIKTRLALLRRRGLLGGHRGDQGYPLTDKAVELLSALE